MRKLYILGLALSAIFALGAIATTSALATDEFLINGEQITSVFTGTSSSEFELTDEKQGDTVACSGVTHYEFIEWFWGLYRTIRYLSLTGIQAKENLEAPGLVCTGLKGCSAEGAEVWPEHLPWTDVIELMSSSPIWLLHISGEGAGKEPAFEILCLVLGITVSEVCEGLISAALENVVGGVSIEFNPAAPVETEKMNCTSGGEHTGTLKSKGTATVEGKTLAVS